MGNPQSYSKTTLWTPPAGATGTSYQIPSFGFDPTNGTATADTIRSESVSITAKITMTWMPDTSLPSDPAPPSVWLIESSSAQWVAQYHDGTPGAVTTTGSGSASDGLANPTDPVVDTTANGTKSGEVSSSSNAPVQTAPPAHWFSQPVSGGVVTLTRTFHASASASLPQDDKSGSMTMSCSFGGYTVKIHAQPYGWYDAGHKENGVFVADPYADNTAGILTYTYGWYSTSGNKSDLSGITIYEVLDYSGNPGTVSADKTTFYPQSPPIISGYNVPNGKAGTPFDAGDPNYPYARDDNSVFLTQTPLSLSATLTWTIPQKYKFDNPATGEVGTVLKDEGNIVEVLQANPNQFTVSKSGSTAKKPL